MSRLTAAMEAVEARKNASFGKDASGLVVGSVFQDRAVFSGFDIDYDELVTTSNLVAQHFNAAAGSGMVAIYQLFFACWVDGLLTGLLAASLDEGGSSGLAPPDDSPAG